MKNNQQGYLIMTFALTLVVVLGFGALTVDVGMLYSARTAAQRTADAAALAGAFTFTANPSAPQPQTAQQQAIQVALNNTIFGTPILDSDLAVAVDVPSRVVTAQLTHTQSTFLARIVGFDSVQISVRADAEASQTATGSSCAKPWFLPNTVLSSTSPCETCALGTELLIVAGIVTAFAQSQTGVQFSAPPDLRMHWPQASSMRFRSAVPAPHCTVTISPFALLRPSTANSFIQ